MAPMPKFMSPRALASRRLKDPSDQLGGRAEFSPQSPPDIEPAVSDVIVDATEGSPVVLDGEALRVEARAGIEAAIAREAAFRRREELLREVPWW